MSLTQPPGVVGPGRALGAAVAGDQRADRDRATIAPRWNVLDVFAGRPPNAPWLRNGERRPVVVNDRSGGASKGRSTGRGLVEFQEPRASASFDGPEGYAEPRCDLVLGVAPNVGQVDGLTLLGR